MPSQLPEVAAVEVVAVEAAAAEVAVVAARNTSAFPAVGPGSLVDGSFDRTAAFPPPICFSLWTYATDGS